MKTFVALLALSAVAVAEPQFGFSPYHHGAAQGFLPYGRAAGFGYPAGQQYPLSYPYNFGGQYRHQAQLPYSYLPFQQQQQAAEPMKTPASTEPLKLVTYASSGAVVPEDTPAVMAAKEAHFSLVKSAEQLQQRVFNPYFYQPQQQQQRVFKREADAQQQFVSPYTAGYAYQQPQPFQYQPYGAPWARHSYNPYFYQPRFPVGYTAAQSAAALYPQQYQQQPFYFPYQQQQQFVTVKADDGSSKIVKRSAEPQQQFAAPLAYNGYYPAQQYQTAFPAAAHAQLPYAPRAYGYPLGYGQYRTPFFGQRAFQPYGFPFAANRFA